MFSVVRNGRALGDIRVAAWAEPAERFAARELARYLGKISGAQAAVREGLRKPPPHSIIVADLSHAATKDLCPPGLDRALAHDGFRIKTIKGRLYIVSREAAGVVFGVYEYLRLFCGCAFLDYGEQGETTPRQATIEHDDVDVLNNPACWYRGMQTNTEEVPGKLIQMVDWMAKNGFSHLLVHLKQTPWEEVRTWLLPEMQKRGIKLALGHHIFALLVSDRDYAAEHPEFFSLVNGKRKKTFQLAWCLSNATLVETVTRKVLQLAEQNPDVSTIELWPDDGVAPACECRKCAKLEHPADREDTDWEWLYRRRDDKLGRRGDRGKMRRYLHLANAVAERLAEAYPKIRLSILSYGDISDPPARDVKIHPNIIVCLAIYWRCSKHTLTDPDCVINRQYVSCIREWLEAVPPESFYLYTYECGMGAWVSLPYPVLHCLFSDWAWLKKLGIGGTHIQSNARNMGVYGLNYAAVGRLLRKESQGFRAYVRDYCRSYFGAAAGPMEQLVLTWESCMRHARAKDVKPAASLFIKKIFRKKDLDACFALCDKALAQTSDPVVRRRVERMRGLVEYCAIYRDAPAALERFLTTGKASPKGMKAIESWLERDEAFLRARMVLDDDVVTRNFAEKMRKNWLGQI